jgi:hypothetical protein
MSSKAEVHVRRAVPSDAGEIAKLHVRAWQGATIKSGRCAPPQATPPVRQSPTSTDCHEPTIRRRDGTRFPPFTRTRGA